MVMIGLIVNSQLGFKSMAVSSEASVLMIKPFALYISDSSSIS